jgi:ribosomal protein S18 acetylase RimI-like enzyme
MPSVPQKAATKGQSSITAWLNKPRAITKADLPTTPPAQTIIPLAPKPEEAPVLSERVPNEASSPTEQQHAPTTKPYSLPPLPANVELVPLTEDLLPGFMRLTSLTLPITYPQVFFRESLEEPCHGITLMALWHVEPPNGTIPSSTEKPRLIGAIRCRILPASTLYISTLGLLSPYRSHGIATYLLQRIIVKASREYDVKSVTAHVWEANDDGLEWYKKRGFEIIGKEDGYYRKLRPQGAVLVRKWIGVADLLGDADTPIALAR